MISTSFKEKELPVIKTAPPGVSPITRAELELLDSFALSSTILGKVLTVKAIFNGIICDTNSDNTITRF